MSERKSSGDIMISEVVTTKTGKKMIIFKDKDGNIIGAEPVKTIADEMKEDCVDMKAMQRDTLYGGNISEILKERGKRYGSYGVIANVTKELWKVLDCSDVVPMSAEQDLAVRMILHKIARILVGDREYADNWDDIAGYSMLGKGVEVKHD